MPRPLYNQYCLSLRGCTGGLQSNPQDGTHTWTNSTTHTNSQWASEMLKGMDTGDAPVSQGYRQRLLRRHALKKGWLELVTLQNPRVLAILCFFHTAVYLQKEGRPGAKDSCSLHLSFLLPASCSLWASRPELHISETYSISKIWKDRNVNWRC